MSTESEARAVPYRIIQLTVENGNARNRVVEDFDGLVTHHPGTNAGTRLDSGLVLGGETGRRHAVIDGEVQEIEVATPERSFGLGPHQVLLKKDFMLEDSRIASGAPGVRNVDVPSPLAGVVGTVIAPQGRVDILDREGGEVIARVRHLEELHVATGDTVAYGQSLGVQGNAATRAVHVHIDVDMRHYEAFSGYVDDLASGRLGIDASRRGAGTQAPEISQDRQLRIGQSSPVVADMQRALNERGYRTPEGERLPESGLYGLSTQPALLQFQRDSGIPETGNLDSATRSLLLPPVREREVDRIDHLDRGRPPEAPELRHPLYQPILGHVEEMDRSIGRTPDESTHRVAAALCAECTANGISRVDGVVLGQKGTKAEAGEYVFAYSGTAERPDDWVGVRTAEAVQTPAEHSFEKAQQIQQQRALQAQQLAQTQQQDAPVRTLS